MAITNHDRVGTLSERKKRAAEAMVCNALVQSCQRTDAGRKRKDGGFYFVKESDHAP